MKYKDLALFRCVGRWRNIRSVSGSLRKAANRLITSCVSLSLALICGSQSHVMAIIIRIWDTRVMFKFNFAVSESRTLKSLGDLLAES